jgi:lipoprotein-releasing system ATP-binding protein
LPLELFRGLSLSVARGERVAIIGASGAGKSSLLHLLAGLDKPTAGEVWLGPTRLDNLRPNEAAHVRNRGIGYVWQFHYLLPEFSAAENIAMPLLARGEGRSQALKTAGEWLARVGLAGRADHRAGELSGGEQQRIAIARALVTGPDVLLADEPTGDLDDRTAAAIFTLIEELCRERQLALVVVTHNIDLARRCDRTLRLANGQLERV